MFYLAVIFAVNIINGVWNHLRAGESGGAMRLIAVSFAYTALIVAVDGLTAYIIRRMPEKYFSAEAEIYNVGKHEREFYRAIKLKSWKQIVPELGCFTGFHKDKLISMNDREYLARFILESNYGIAIHMANAICGAVVLFVFPRRFLYISLPVFATNMLLSVLPVFVLRSNLPSLRLLYKRSISQNKDR